MHEAEVCLLVKLGFFHHDLDEVGQHFCAEGSPARFKRHQAAPSFPVLVRESDVPRVGESLATAARLASESKKPPLSASALSPRHSCAARGPTSILNSSEMRRHELMK
jgi:hypothetical protein